MSTINNIFVAIIILMNNYFIISMLDLFISIKNNSKIIKVTAIILLSILSHIINEILHIYIIYVIALVIFLLIYCMTVHHTNIKKSLLSISIVIANITVFNILFIIIGSLFTPSPSYMLFDSNYVIISNLIIFFNKLLLIIEYVFIKSKKDSGIVVPDRAVIYFLVTEILYIIIILVFANNYVIYDRNKLYLTGGIAFFCIANILLYKLAVLLSSYYNDAIQKQLYIDAIKYEKEIINTVQEKYNFINRWNHDLKNMLLKIQTQTLYDKQSLNNSLNSLDELINKIDMENKYILSNNSTINYILNSKIKKIKKLGVDVKIVINGNIINTLEELDISMLLTSVLENALLIAREYASNILDFFIQTDNEKNQIIIKTVNYCAKSSSINKDISKLRDYEVSKLNKLCSDNNRMFYQSRQNDEIISIVVINL